jgi:hypothetical protein
VKLKVSHVFNLALSAFALFLFAINLRTELAGEHFDLRTGDGATILTVFLVAGVVVQLGKLAQGHESAFELTITLLLLGAHVIGDIYIWYRTQIQDLALPAQIPFLIIGGYWLIGVVDFASMFLPSQLKLYNKAYVSPEQRAIEAERRAERAEFERDQALKDAAKASKDAERVLEEASRVYEATCEDCGKVFSKSSQRQADAARDGHKRACKGAPPYALSSNGHKHETEAIHG